MVFLMVKGHISLSINGGNSRMFASNLLMSLSGQGHSITPQRHTKSQNRVIKQLSYIITLNKLLNFYQAQILQKRSCLNFVQQINIDSHASRRYDPCLQISFTIQRSCLNNMSYHKVLKMYIMKCLPQMREKEKNSGMTFQFPCNAAEREDQFQHVSRHNYLYIANSLRIRGANQNKVTRHFIIFTQPYYITYMNILGLYLQYHQGNHPHPEKIIRFTDIEEHTI